MKFCLGPYRLTHNALINPKSILATSNDALLLRGMALGLVPGFCTYLFCLGIADNRTIFFWLDQSIVVFLALFVGVAVAHEFAHLLVSPGFGTHPDNVLGFDHRICTPYVTVQAPMGKNMAIAHALAPTVLLTPVAMLACVYSKGDARGGFAMIAIINSASVGADWMMAWRMLRTMGLDDHYQDGYYGKAKSTVLAPLDEE